MGSSEWTKGMSDLVTAVSHLYWSSETVETPNAEGEIAASDLWSDEGISPADERENDEHIPCRTFVVRLVLVE